MKAGGASALFATFLLVFLFCAKDGIAQEGDESAANPLTQNPWVDSSQSSDIGQPNCGDWEHHLSGTISGTGKAVGLIAGARWGKGTLTLVNGETHPFTYNGIKLIDVAVSSVEFTGEVYNLSRIEDFIGNYVAAASGAGLVVREGEVVANNGKCVVIKAKSTGEGAALAVPGPAGFFVQLAPHD